MDKNTLAGFGLLILLLIGYIFYNQSAENKIRQKQHTDSLSQSHKSPFAAAPTVARDSSSSRPDSLVPEKIFTLENQDISLQFSNHGAYPFKAILKKFKTYDGKPLILFEGTANQMDLSFKNNTGRLVHTGQQVYEGGLSADGHSLSFTSSVCNVSYRLPESGYMLDMHMQTPSSDKSQSFLMQWNSQSKLTEPDLQSQQLYTQICYNLEQEGYDHYGIKSNATKEFKEPLKWVSFKQHYFNSTLIPEPKSVTALKVSSALCTDTVSKNLSAMQSELVMRPADAIHFRLFLGPNDYRLLKSYQLDLQEIIPLSYGIFGFVKYINTWIVIPIFHALSSVFHSYGIVILLLTFIIRLLMSPFTYKSYVSSAKMKALKPEMDELRAKYGDDKQAFGMEQMKLYRQAGVNPLGGCLPALLQLPVFFALLSFFPHAIELRQEKFLWAHDLSTFDSVYNLPFTIPFYGDHISLFTLLFVVTSLVLSLYSMNMTVQDQSNPMMKYMPFIMPVMFLGIFNKLPAALTYYYFVSNVITLGLQFVIQQYIIDPEKIHAQIQAKKNEAPKENKFLARMAEMQRQQQERAKKK